MSQWYSDGGLMSSQFPSFQNKVPSLEAEEMRQLRIQWKRIPMIQGKAIDNLFTEFETALSPQFQDLTPIFSQLS